MAFIRISCGCGRSMKVDTVHAGKKVKCPDCGELSVIPAEGRDTTSGPVVPPPAAEVDAPAAGDAPASAAASAAASASTASGKMRTASGKSAVAGSGKSAASTASGKSSTVAPPKPASEPGKPGAEPAAPVRKGGSGYDLLGAVLAAGLAGLFFVEWIRIADPAPRSGGGPVLKVSGFHIAFNQSTPLRDNMIEQLKKQGTKSEAVQALTDRFLDAEWAPMLLMGYLGVTGLTLLVCLLNWLTGAVGPRASGGLMTLGGLGAMGIIAAVVFALNRLPSELGDNFVRAYAYKGQIPAFATMGLAFVLFGFGIIYFLTGGAPAKGRPAPRRAMIGGGPAPTSFEMPE